MDILDELKDRVELDDRTQKKVLAATPLALIGGAVIVASLLKHKPLHVRETAVALGANGRRVAQELAGKIPFLNKSKM